MNLETMGALAKAASYELLKVSTVQKNNALSAMAQAILDNSELILQENQKDLANAKEKGIKQPMMDRLALSPERLQGMSDGIMQIVSLQDPVGEVPAMWTRPNGLQIGQKRVPLGVIGIIYEARPNVTSDAAALCIKASNAVILRGGSEAIHSNLALCRVMQQALQDSGMPDGTLQMLDDPSRETATKFMRLSDYIDVLIPRGGAGLISTVVSQSTIPVIETGLGNCHAYVDADADIDMALDIVVNAKCSRPSVCNAIETTLVHTDISNAFLPLAKAKLEAGGITLRGCEKTCAIIDAEPATDADWDTEYNDYILAVKVVDNLDQAIAHINKHGTKHSEVIITQNYANSQRFLQEVDAAAVYVNASTRFTDGEEFGFGAEIGISTQKMHARGPMGLLALTSIKYVIYGNGQVR